MKKELKALKTVIEISLKTSKTSTRAGLGPAPIIVVDGTGAQEEQQKVKARVMK
jgi:hypothetical protein